MHEAWETTTNEEKYLTGLRQRNSKFMFFKWCTVLKIQDLSGPLDGAMKPYLALLEHKRRRNNNFSFQIQQVYRNTRGRFISCDVKI